MSAFDTAAEQTAWEQLTAHLRRGALIGSVESVLSYDEQTVMPAGAAEYRGEQLAWLGGVAHQHATDPRVGEWLAALQGVEDRLPQDDDIAATLREARRDYRQRTQLPQALVEELARVKVAAQQVWVAARKAADFTSFAPYLDKLLRLKREEAAALLPVLSPVGDETPPVLYDALLDQYEPGARSAAVGRVLYALRDELSPLIRELVERGTAPDDGPIHREFPIAAQQEFGRMMAARIGFDFAHGRLDVTAHPFCSELGPGDTRITTRYNPRAFNEAFFGILHETGHGLYDQGLRRDWYGLGPGQYLSLGIHESQSRLWENLVGRSAAFWEFAWPAAQAAFPTALGDLQREDFYRAINRVEPSLIRVEADEATYNLHIGIRFELEQELLHDQLSVADLPGAWNELYQRDLGITPPDAARGVLQDIHWSSGLMGYFATYALGNLYASQFFAAARIALGDLDEQFRRGEFRPLLDWLRGEIHRVGRTVTAPELVRRVTGAELNSVHLLRHLREKFRPLYGLA